MISKAAFMVAGALLAHFYSEGLFPSSHAAWAWGCSYYEKTDIKAPKYMAVGATDGPKCDDGASLTCSCPAEPCTGKNAALPSNLICAGAGDDAATSGCFKLHHTYGTPVGAHAAVSGRGEAAQVSDACGAADVIKVYGNAMGLDMLKQWGAVTMDIIDNSTHPTSAQQCQSLCAANADCKFFTFNDQGSVDPNYQYFFGLCVLHKELNCTGAKYSTFHGAIAGPSACPAGVTVPAAVVDIVDTAVAAGSFTVLAEALTAANLITTMKSPGPYTVFAPTDAAFTAALTALGLTKEELLKSPDLASILTYHVVPGAVKSTDLTNGMTPATVNGGKVTITIDGSTVMLNGKAKVTTADVMCRNGVIHIIDTVIMPPTLKDIVDTAVAAGSFTVLAEALTKADLVTTLKGTGPFTVFAPTDTAFEALLKKMKVTKEELLKSPDLASILKYHVVSGTVKSTDLTNGMKADTVNGAKVTITIDGSTVMLNGAATVTTADVMASNGVIHIIDTVLEPPAASTTSTSGTGTTAGTSSATSGTGTTASGTTTASSDVSSAKTSQGLVSLTLGAALSASLFA